MRLLINYIIAVFSFILLSISVLAQDNLSAEALPGEGIYGLLRRHNLNPGDYLNAFLELNKDKLDENLQLIKGKTYLIPTVAVKETAALKKSTGTFPIFGEKYQEVEFKDELLRGAVFYIVPGHGGPDPGAVAKTNGHQLCEDEYAYDIALRLARNLIEHHAMVYVITRDPNDGIRDEAYLKCDKDEYCWGNKKIPLNITQRLNQKVNAVNQLYEKHSGQYQRKIELHVDSRYSDQKVDIFFYYYPGSNKGKKLGVTLLNTIKQKYEENQPNRGYRGTVSERNLYTLRNTKPVSSYIELGNINHDRDRRRLVIESNRQAIANWLTLGLIKDFENSRK